RSGIEAHAERSDVRAELLRGRLEFRAIAAAAEFRVGQVALVAVRKAEMHPGARRVVQFVRRQVVAQPVAAVVGEPEFARARMPVEADGIPDSFAVNSKSF